MTDDFLKKVEELKDVSSALNKKFNDRVGVRSGLNRGYSHMLDFAMLEACEAINEYSPKQGEKYSDEVVSLVNFVMNDYKGKLTEKQILSNRDKPFMPQPGMLQYWAESNKFRRIKKNGSSLNNGDVAGKFVLTYYVPFANTWAIRSSDDISDETNKHWYSHAKSSLYDDKGKAIQSSNPEAFYNDNIHDGTVYAPFDSVSYEIDYKRFGLSRKDIEDGLAYLNEGINIMDPEIQNMIHGMGDCGLSRDDIIKLWQNKIDFSNNDNLTLIKNHMQKGGNKDDILKIKGLSMNQDNGYKYNLQDYSCAIQPTAPILYATSAKIYRENLTDEQANDLREKIGLYNIYDEKNYRKINKAFYDKYSSHVREEALKEIMDFFIMSPKVSPFMETVLIAGRDAIEFRENVKKEINKKFGNARMFLNRVDNFLDGKVSGTKINVRKKTVKDPISFGEIER